ncbi:MAG: ribonuclease HII [Thalassolituus sp.]|nr:ribonuclease HII [Pseudomonadota bacterium]MEC8103848.1 ribonuclease HII [Pseudomonadota bacterium]MEC8524853.1 ribonuclease HII [Pseudomonadota bacterium]TNC84289.1 MAG: ribonuclease HII [Thalassolituus sp.]|tara:strand:+ start:596 stop:1222 length:627 start_codon:yes stop_codon:yes gene_type:complete
MDNSQVQDLTEEESALLENGLIYCGVDEAGAGPLCGDVVAAAVILNPDDPIPELTDSKKLTEKKRERLFDEIREKAVDFCVASASVEEIDRLNILNARMLAMTRAVEGLRLPCDHALIDGNKLPKLNMPATALIKGDARVAAISAASVLAKVQRDRDMVAMEERFPGYGFAKHKGYGTKMHLEALEALGPCEIHRRSYAPVKRLLTKS